MRRSTDGGQRATVESELDGLRADLERSHGELMSLLRSDFEGSLPSANPAWDVRAVMSHLVGAKVGMLARVRQAGRSSAGLPTDFYLERWNRRQVEKRAGRRHEELAAELDRAHRELMSFMAGAGDDVLDSPAEHPVAGPTTVRGILRIIYLHEQEHIAEIRAALGAQG